MQLCEPGCLKAHRSREIVEYAEKAISIAPCAQHVWWLGGCPSPDGDPKR